MFKAAYSMMTVPAHSRLAPRRIGTRLCLLSKRQEDSAPGKLISPREDMYIGNLETSEEIIRFTSLTYGEAHQESNGYNWSFQTNLFLHLLKYKRIIKDHQTSKKTSKYTFKNRDRNIYIGYQKTEFKVKRDMEGTRS